MTKNNVLKLGEILGLKKPKIVSDAIMYSCPFAPKRHKRGTDRKPSFGISIGAQSVYNCFSCNSKGFLSSLPSNLAFITGKDYSEARDFILKNDSVEFEDYDSLQTNLEPLPAINEDTLKKLSDVPGRIKKDLRLAKKIIDYFELKYYNKDQRVIIPVRDNFGRLIALKGRYTGQDKKILENYKFIFYKGKDLKQKGVWLNMHRPLVESKALIISESESDTMHLYNTGLVSNIWCSMGAKITPAQIFNLQQLSNPVVLFLDNDKAGIESTNKLIKELKGLMPLYKVTNYYGENDIVDLILKNKIKSALRSIKSV